MAENEILSHARERAEKRLDTALGEIRKSIQEIARTHSIPEGVLGHDVVDLLGRVMFVPSLSRELRKEAGQIMAKQELAALQDAPLPVRQVQHEAPPAAPTGGQPVIPTSLSVDALQGITVAQVKALNGAGLVQVGDLVNIPDEHLAKVTGLDAKAIGKIRAAVAKASAPK